MIASFVTLAGIGFILFLIIEGFAIASAVHALFTVRTAQGTIAWVVGLIAFPWLGVPLYWMFGSRRFGAYSTAMREALVKHQGLIHGVRSEMEPHQIPREEIHPAGVGNLSAIAAEPFMRGNQLTLLIDGTATFDALLADIMQAKISIFVQFYIMREDGIGTRLLEALAAKAAEGLEVCFLIDSIGSADMKPAILEKWNRRGIHLRTFCANTSWRNRWQLNFRNHRKNVIIDGLVGYIGGHNVGDEYLGLDPQFGRWRDTHVRVEGPTVMQLQMIFAADYFFATGEALLGHWESRLPASTPGNQRALVLASGPSDDYERCTLFFLNAISLAKERLWIASPYFVPDEGIIQALQLAAIRGVEVKILLPMKPDQILVWLASFAVLTELTHPNIQIYRFTGGFLHQKCLLVDEDFSAVGTANFDNRSFRLNFEITLAVADAGFTAEVARMFEMDFAESAKIDPHDYESRPLYFKAAARAARLLAPIL